MPASLAPVRVVQPTCAQVARVASASATATDLLAGENQCVTGKKQFHGIGIVAKVDVLPSQLQRQLGGRVNQAGCGSQELLGGHQPAEVQPDQLPNCPTDQQAA